MIIARAVMPLLLVCIQAWTFPAGLHTVGAVVANVASGLALALANSTLFTGPHGWRLPLGLMQLTGTAILQLVASSPIQPCTTSRDCEGCHGPSRLWYVDPTDGFLVHSTYTASINHCFDGGCYELTGTAPDDVAPLPGTRPLCAQRGHGLRNSCSVARPY